MVGLRVVAAGPLTRTAHHKCLVGVLRVGKTSAEWRQRPGTVLDGDRLHGVAVLCMAEGTMNTTGARSKIGGRIAP